jgi:hypothetical protein
MSPSEAAIIVARFLKANSYDEVWTLPRGFVPRTPHAELSQCQTLDAFIKEAGLPPSAGSTNKGDLTLEKILEEKRTFDMSLHFEKLGTDEGAHGWSQHGKRPTFLFCRSSIYWFLPSTRVAEWDIRPDTFQHPSHIAATGSEHGCWVSRSSRVVEKNSAW